MVGEIRDKETAGLAINAALTGHLVLSTLHTMDAPGALPRLIDMQVEPFLIASTINTIIAQRLVRRLCDEREEYKIEKHDLELFSQYADMERVKLLLGKEKILKEGQSLTDISFYRPKPTKDCPDGYKGRIGIYEALPATETIKKLIEQRASADQIREQAKKEGMITMLEDGFVKAARGITSIEEVFRVISE